MSFISYRHQSSRAQRNDVSTEDIGTSMPELFATASEVSSVAWDLARVSAACRIHGGKTPVVPSDLL